MNLSKKFDISFILLILSVALGMYFCQNIVVVFEADPRRYLTINEYLPLYLITLTPSIIYAVIKFKQKEKYRCFDIVIGVLFIFLLAFCVYTVLDLPTGISTYGFDTSMGEAYRFDYSESTKLFSILFASISLITAYIMLVEIPKKFRTDSHVIFYAVICLLICLAFLLYSYITQFDEYVEAIKTFGTQTPQVTFIDRNNLCVWLFYMMFVCFFINNKKPSFIWYLLAIFLFANICLHQSKINMAMGVVLLIGYYIHRTVLTWNKHKKLNVAILSAISLCFVAIITYFVIFMNKENTLANKVLEKFKYLFSWTGVTAGTRVEIWKNCFCIFSNSSWIKGLGFGTFNKVLEVYRINATNFDKITDLPHNAFIEYLGIGGIPLLTVALGIIIYTLIIAIKCRKIDRSFSFLIVLTWILYLVHMVFDSNTPIFISSTPIIDSLFTTYILIIPVYSKYYHVKHKEDNTALLDENENSLNLKKDQFSSSKVLYFFITLLISLLFAYSLYFKSKIGNDYFVLICMGLIFVFALIPILERFIHKYNFGSYFIRVLLPTIIVGFITSFSTYHLLTHFNEGTTLYWIISFVYGTSIYSLLICCVPYLHSLANPLINLLQKINKKVIKIESKGIIKNEHN